MRNTAIQLGIVLMSIGMLVVQPAQADGDTEELKKVREKVSTMFEEINPENIQPSPIDGWYTVRKGAVVAYISGDGRYLLQGDLIDLDSQVNLSETERNLARIEMMAAVTDDELITFTPDEVKYRVSIFTDIDCGYCRRLHSQIDEYLAQGIEINYLLYPRSGPGPPFGSSAVRGAGGSSQTGWSSTITSTREQPRVTEPAGLIANCCRLGACSSSAFETQAGGIGWPRPSRCTSALLWTRVATPLRSSSRWCTCRTT